MKFGQAGAADSVRRRRHRGINSSAEFIIFSRHLKLFRRLQSNPIAIISRIDLIDPCLLLEHS